jgi:hypothetical protein
MSIKNIKELELLVNFAKSLGQTPDPKMVEQVREHYEFQKKIVDSVKANAAKDLNEAFGQKIIEETKDELVQTNTIEEIISEETLPDSPTEQSLADRAAQLIKDIPKKDSFQQPNIPFVDGSMKAIQDKLRFLEQWLGKVSMAGPGGGAVKLRDLDDVSKSSIKNATEHQYLTYNAQSKLWIASNHSNYDIKLDDLVDVVITAPRDGQVLKFDGVSNAWVAATDIAVTQNGAPVISFSDLTVVTLPEQSGGTFRYNSNTGVFSHAPSYQDRLINGNAVVLLSAAGETTHPGNIIPLVTNVYTLGSPNLKWKEVFVGPGSVYIEDTVTHQNAALTVTAGVLKLDGANQLQVGQLKFANNTIQSTTPNIDIQVGYLTDTANLVFNRDVVLANGKSLRFLDNTIQTTAFTASAVNAYVRPMLTTANVIESSSNLYFTNTRVVSALSTDSTLTLNANGKLSSNLAYGQFWDTTTQLSNANTATLMRFNKADGRIGVSLANANTRVILQNVGTYNLQFSSQFVNTDNSPQNTWIWFRQANVDLEDSAGLLAVPKKDGPTNGSIIVSWNTFVTTTTPNDYVELLWFTIDQAKNQMTAYANISAVPGVTPAIPAIPSVILTVEQIR